MRIHLLLLAIHTALAAQSDARVRELDRYTAQAVRDWNVPGLSIAVVHDGRIAFAKGYGLLDVAAAGRVHDERDARSRRAFIR